MPWLMISSAIGSSMNFWMALQGAGTGLLSVAVPASIDRTCVQTNPSRNAKLTALATECTCSFS